MKSHRIGLAVAALLAMTLPAFGQGVSGITGLVKDADGGVLPGVSVTVKNVATALTRVSTTSGEGRYSLQGLTPGTYEVTAKLQGFGDHIEKVTTLVGQVAPLNIVMRPAGLSTTVEVQGSVRPLIETSESEVSTAISEELIAALPVAERNAITLALLAPGVSAAPYYDPTKTRDSFDGFSFGGGSASSSWTLVDGGDNNDGVVGGILQFYPQESIQEFEIITSRFKAEYGHTDGGVVNMITKSGTNTLSGGGYYQVRDKSLNAKTFVEKDAKVDKAEFHQDVIGGYLGGPISSDKLFFFGNADYTKRKKSLLSSTGGQLPEVDAQGQNAQDPKQTLAVAKLTGNMGSSNFMGRYAYQKDSAANSGLASGDGSEHGYTNGNKYHAFLVKDTSVFGGNKLNEVLYQFNRFQNDITSNAAGSAFEGRNINIEGGTYNFGNNVNAPQQTKQDKHQLVDHFSTQANYHGDHDLKFGAEYTRVNIGGFFATGLPFAQFNFDSLETYRAGGFADTVSVTVGSPLEITETYNNLFALFLQDDWKPSENLTLNLGVRYDMENNDWNQGDLTFLSADPLFFGAQPQTDKNNFGPKLGFAYDVKGDSRIVVRGGYGLYYQQVFYNTPLRAQYAEGQGFYSFDVNSGVNFRPTDPFCATAGVQQAGCIPSPLTPAPTGSAFVGSSALTGADPRIKTPYTHQFTLGMSNQLPHNFAFDVDLVRSQSDNQIFRTRIAGRSAINGLNISSNWATRGRTYTQAGKQEYTGLLLGLRNRMKDLTTQVSYTYGRGKGNVARQGDQIIDDSDAGFDRNFGPNFAQRDHALAASMTYNLPYGMQLGTILKWQSGFAFTGFDPSQGDVDGDLRSTDSIAGHRGDYRGDSFFQTDVRVSKSFTLAERYKPQVFLQVFNLFNARNEKADDVVTDISNSRFGTSNTPAGQPFQAELSVRFDF